MAQFVKTKHDSKEGITCKLSLDIILGGDKGQESFKFGIKAILPCSNRQPVEDSYEAAAVDVDNDTADVLRQSIMEDSLARMLKRDVATGATPDSQP